LKVNTVKKSGIKRPEQQGCDKRPVQKDQDKTVADYTFLEIGIQKHPGKQKGCDK